MALSTIILACNTGRMQLDNIHSENYYPQGAWLGSLSAVDSFIPPGYVGRSPLGSANIATLGLPVFVGASPFQWKNLEFPVTMSGYGIIDHATFTLGYSLIGHEGSHPDVNATIQWRCVAVPDGIGVTISGVDGVLLEPTIAVAAVGGRALYPGSFNVLTDDGNIDSWYVLYDVTTYWEYLWVFKNELTIYYAPVAFSSVTPNIGPGGTVVTIHGSGFLAQGITALTAVRFGAYNPEEPWTAANEPQDATDLVVEDDTTLHCTVPPFHGSWDPDHQTVSIQFQFAEVTSPAPAFTIPSLFTYGVGQWWFNPTSGHYVFAAESPGAPFVASDAPTITVTGVSPRST